MKTNFSSETLEDMRCRLPEYLTAIGVELRRQGARLVGKCPTHDDSSPSFAVLPNGKTCGCYPCDFQGDIFAASQWMGRSDSFTSAVRDVADTLGIYLPDSTAGTATKPATAPPFVAHRRALHFRQRGHRCFPASGLSCVSTVTRPA